MPFSTFAVFSSSRRRSKAKKKERQYSAWYRRQRLGYELLESRRLLATVSDDNSSVLSIELEADENAYVVSLDSSYFFTTDKVFQDDGVSRPEHFSEFGQSTLLLKDGGMVKYSEIKISSSSSTASFHFLDSAANRYYHDFFVDLSSSSDSTVFFDGHSSFNGDGSLFVSANAITTNPYSRITSESGDIRFLANSGVTNFGVLESLDGTITLDSDWNTDSHGTTILASELEPHWRLDEAIQETALTSSARFGEALAMSGDKSTLVVGAPGHDLTQNGNQGIVTIYSSTNDGWVKQQSLSDISVFGFGVSVAVSDDGNVIVVGAQRRAYIYHRLDGVWTLAVEYSGIRDFGRSVAISGDGNVAVIGEPNVSSGTNPPHGVAYVYARSGDTWGLLQQLASPFQQSSDRFGFAVSLSENGATIVVGASQVDIDDNIDQGAVAVYTRVGSTWQLEAITTAPVGSVVDSFGSKLDLVSDGSVAVVGAPLSRAVYILRKLGTEWSVELLADRHSLPTNSSFGGSVSISDDANRVIVGASREARTFERKGDQWEYVFSANSPTFNAGPDLGHAVALSNDGTKAILGAPSAVGTNGNQGMVISYTYVNGYPASSIVASSVSIAGADIRLQGTVIASEVLVESTFGRRISIGGVEGERLNLTPEEISRITTERLMIGSDTSGNLEIEDKVVLNGINEMRLISGNSVFVAQSVYTNGSQLSILAKENIQVTHTINTGGGILELDADSDADGTGTLTLSDRILAEYELSGHHGRGSHAVISGDGRTAVLSTGGTNTQHEYSTVFKLENNMWVAKQTIPVPVVNSRLYHSRTLAVNHDGSVIAVGTPFVGVNGNANQGKVQIFRENDGLWELDAELIRPTGSPEEWFGFWVRLSGDGKTAVVYYRSESDDAFPLSVFQEVNGVWLETQSQLPYQDSDGVSSFDISSDGQVIFIGSELADVSPHDNRGIVTVFKKDQGIFVEHQTLVPDDHRLGEQLGSALALSGDGSIAVVGAERYSGTNGHQGAAHIFIREGEFWVPRQRIVSLEPQNGAFFGAEVRLSLDGEVITVGEFSTSPDELGNGAVHVFQRSSNLWEGRQILRAEDTIPDDGYFGTVLAMSGDGGHLFIRQGLDFVSHELSVPGGEVRESSEAYFIAADVEINSPVSVDFLNFHSTSENRSIDLGSQVASSLSLTDIELDKINAVTLAFGENSAGKITISAPITREDQTNIHFASSERLEFTGDGTVDSASGNMLLRGVGPANIRNHSSAQAALNAGDGDILLTTQRGVIGEEGSPMLLAGAGLSISSGRANEHFVNVAGEIDIVAPGVAINGGELRLGGGTIRVTSENSLASNTKLSVDGATVDLAGYSISLSRLELLSGHIIGDGQITTGSTTDVSSGSLSASLNGDYGVKKLTEGLVTLAGTQQYRGETVLQAGTLVLMDHSSDNPLLHSSLLELHNGAVIDVMNLSNSTLQLRAEQTLRGNGTIVGSLSTQPQSTVVPSSSHSLHVTENIVLDEGQLEISLGSPETETQTRLVSDGQLSLENASLTVLLSHTPQLGEEYIIVDNRGTLPVQGEFLALPQDTVFSVGASPFSANFRIVYNGGDGNDISLIPAETLDLTIDPPEILENGGTAVGIISRQASSLVSLQVQLLISNPDIVSVPTFVTIPAGELNASFSITAIDNSIVDGNHDVDVRPVAVGFVTTVSQIRVIDDDVPELTLVIDRTEMDENGGTAQLTVSRNTNLDVELEVSISSTDDSEVSVTDHILLPIGVVSVSFPVESIDDFVVDGSQLVTIRAIAEGHSASETTVVVLDDDVPELRLLIEDNVLAESGGTTTATIFRNTSTNDPLTVSVSTSDSSEIIVPAELTIPAGAVSTTFIVQAIDDSIVDGRQEVDISASATNHSSASVRVAVLDNDVAELQLQFSEVVISEAGGSIEVTVSRNTTTESSLTVLLLSSDTSEASVPTSVTIPAGTTTATFLVTAVDDFIVDGTQEVSISASAENHGSAEGLVQITDDDLPELSLALEETSLSENGGTALATISRNTLTDLLLDVFLESSDEDEAVAPVQVTIPAGASSVSFEIVGVDDAIVDGNQLVRFVASASLHASATADVLVTDDDEPMLVMTILDAQINENGGITQGKITRNTDTSQQLLVYLTAHQASALAIPTTISIPEGATTAEFTINAIDNTQVDGPRDITLTATAEGHANAAMNIAITDDDVPTLTLVADNSLIDENGGETTLTVIRNTDPSASLLVQLSNSEPENLVTPLTVLIPAGEDRATFSIQAVDNSLVDGQKRSIIAASAESYLNGVAEVTITDDDLPSLHLVVEQDVISEDGGYTHVVISRNTEPLEALAVAVSAELASQLSFPSIVVIPAGDYQATFLIESIDNSLVDGDRSVRLLAHAVEHAEAHTVLQITDDDSPLLSVTLEQVYVSESQGSLTVTVARNTDTHSALEVTVAVDAEDALLLPEQVLIPAGAISASFEIRALDNQRATGDIAVELRASALAHAAAVAMFEIIDDDSPALSIHFDQGSISEEMGETRGTVTRNTGTDSPLVVTLTASNQAKLAIPTEVIIPSGSDSATFIIQANDDAIVDGNQTIAVTANADDHIDAVQSIDIIDNDIPQVQLQPGSVVINEGDSSTLFTVYRNTATASELIVTLEADNDSSITVPATVVIPSGASFITFPIEAIDDAFAFGQQTVVISASTKDFTTGIATVEVHDNDDPELQLEIAVVSMSENDGTALVTVTRNTPPFAALSTTIEVSDPTKIEFPASVTIPAGEYSVTFLVSAIDDSNVEADVFVEIQVAAESHQGDVASVLIIEDDRWTWTNQRDPLDVNDSGSVTPIDALIIINFLNRATDPTLPPLTEKPPYFYDVNGNGTVTPIDALRIVNKLNRGEGEGPIANGSLIRPEEELLLKRRLLAIDRFFEELQ